MWVSSYCIIKLLYSAVIQIIYNFCGFGFFSAVDKHIDISRCNKYAVALTHIYIMNGDFIARYGRLGIIQK